MASIRSFALFISLALAIASAQDETVSGSYNQKDITDEDVNLLTKVASDVSMYSADVAVRICLFAVESLHVQVVGGINYKFLVAGCNAATDEELGACVDRNCEHYNYNVVIFSHAWNDTLLVTSITPAD